MRIIAIYILLFSLLPACHRTHRDGRTTTSPRVKNPLKLEHPAIGSTHLFGSPIDFKLSLSGKGKALDSVKFYATDTTFVSAGYTFSWTPETRVGKKKLTITGFSGSDSFRIFPYLSILSELVPLNPGYEVLATYPHDTTSYTQGLFLDGDFLIESTGKKRKSKLRKVNVRSGEVAHEIQLEKSYFGEGVTRWKDRIFQLTWTSKKVLVYDLELNPITTFTHANQGWGLTTLGDTLFLSDGSEKLYLHDPKDFSKIGEVEVYDHEGKVGELNELEAIEGMIYANVYRKDEILVIEPTTGRVMQRIDLSSLPTRAVKPDRTEHALNGIAYSADLGLLVTGKLWDTIYGIRVTPTAPLK